MSLCIRCGRHSTSKDTNTNYAKWTFIRWTGGSSRGELTSSWIHGIQVYDPSYHEWNTIGLCPECHISYEQKENILNTE